MFKKTKEIYKMKKLTMVMMILMLGLATLTFAGKPLATGPLTAIQQDGQTRSMFRSLEKSGYELVEQKDQQIFYFMQPSGTHAWGSIVFTYIRSYGDYSLQKDYAVVIVYIQTVVENGIWLGYRISGFDVQKSTVY